MLSRGQCTALLLMTSIPGAQCPVCCSVLADPHTHCQSRSFADGQSQHLKKRKRLKESVNVTNVGRKGEV